MLCLVSTRRIYSIRFISSINQSEITIHLHYTPFNKSLILIDITDRVLLCEWYQHSLDWFAEFQLASDFLISCSAPASGL